MDRSTAVILTAFTGGLIALQAPINSLLGKSLGDAQAAFVSFLIGTIALLGIALVAGGLGSVREVTDVPWHYLLGGLLGAAYVTCVLITVRSLGAGGVTAATIAGQLAMSVIVDRFGWLGVDKEPITGQKIIGLALLAGGTFLVVRD